MTRRASPRLAGAYAVAIAKHGADAIGEDPPYILTHPEYWPAIEQRQKAVEAAFRARR